MPTSFAPLLPLLALLSPPSAPDSMDNLRIQEAYRLVASVQDSVWPGGWGKTPFPLLLVGADQEYLYAFPRTPPGFTREGAVTPGYPAVLERPRQFAPTLLATFPAFGPPSVIVVGQPAATQKNSTAWVLTVIHEHFHQFQSADPGYYAAVDSLDLAGGDRSGMWMLNYPFPYATAPLAEHFATLARALGRLVQTSTPAERRDFWQSYGSFLDELSPRDRRYLGFQLWQEGVARYVELRGAEVAARVHQPTQPFAALPDFEPFLAAAHRLRTAIIDELASPDLPGRKRESFYAFGAGLALLLDLDVPGWKRRYQTERFAVERYLLPTLSSPSEPAGQQIRSPGGHP